MSEATIVEDGPNIRLRRACSNCYERKIKCDYNPETGTCTLCQKNKMKCEVPSGDATKPRKSIRATVDDLESRVLSLEGFQGPWSTIARTPQSSSVNFASNTTMIPPNSSGNAIGTSPLAETRSIPLTRGGTSPWSILLSSIDDSNPALQSLRASTLATAESESSFSISHNSISYDMLVEVPGLTSAKMYEYARNYACVAPYPILHWDSLNVIVTSSNEPVVAMPVGQTTCIWIYMAFGAAHMLEMKSDLTTSNEPGIYFEQAWKLLPQLLLNYDIWALKAVTLMVHYLQASAKPQACWALLGTALRLAASLGFDRAENPLSIYSNVEQEEGRRAFWLCHIMEKSLCINLGHSSPPTASANVRTPQPFVSKAAKIESDIFGENEQDATNFFCEMIDLTKVRDNIFTAIESDQTLTDDSYQLLLSRLQIINRSGGMRSEPASVIRDCIHKLAYYNTLQVLATTRLRTHGGQILDEAVISARDSLDLISESQKSGQLMCLWMWLYYAFTSAVVLFLHSIANLLDHDNTLNLAAISDFEDICSRVKDVSEGATQCMEIAKAMRVAIHKLAKIAGRKRSREAEDLTENGSSKRKVQPDRTAPANVEEPSSFSWQQSTAADPEVVFAEAPANFAWDEWDKWLQDVTLPVSDDL